MTKKVSKLEDMTKKVFKLEDIRRVLGLTFKEDVATALFIIAKKVDVNEYLGFAKKVEALAEKYPPMVGNLFCALAIAYHVSAVEKRLTKGGRHGK